VGSPSTDKNSDMHGINVAAAIFAQYGPFIRAIIRSRIGHQAHEEDLFQDLFLSIAHNPPADDSKNIKKYLYRAITRDIVDAIRRMIAYRAMQERFCEKFKYSTNKTEAGSALINDGEDIDWVFRLIETRLPESQARAIILRYKHGYDAKEVAERMNIDRKTAIWYVSVGLRRIRQIFHRKTGEP